MKMREMLRCLICGRSAWPTMIARGQLGLHRIESLLFVKGRGCGRGVDWDRKDLSRNPAALRAWAALLKSVYLRVKRILESLGDEVEDLPEIRDLTKPIHSPILMKPQEIVRLKILERPPVRGAM